EQIIQHKIAAADRVQTVARDACESQIHRKLLAIHGKSAACQRSAAERTCVRCVCGTGDAVEIVEKSFGVSEHEMRKQNRLCGLHVRHSRHRHTEIALSLHEECTDELSC